MMLTLPWPRRLLFAVIQTKAIPVWHNDLKTSIFLNVEETSSNELSILNNY